MNTAELQLFFSERYDEVQAYLEFLTELEDAARKGPPRFDGSATVVSVAQQRILYSSIYLQLYNLVEATVSRCVEAVASAASDGGRWYPEDLCAELQGEWVRVVARTHVDLNPPKRLANALEMMNHLVSRLPISTFQFELGGGGNWDDQSIQSLVKRLGLKFNVKRNTLAAVKRKRRDDMGALKLVKDRRNRLAHGALSFVECADGVVVDELRDLVLAVGDFLDESIGMFVRYIDSFDFLSPAKQAGATGK